MSLTASTMLPLGTVAPDFKLPDANGNLIALADFKNAPALLVMFICNHCPYVKLIRGGLAQLGRDYKTKNVAIIAINSNDAEHYPDDNPARMREEIKAAGYIFPYLIDDTQEVAKAYHAACTPDFFLFDAAQKLLYRGQFDDARPGNDAAITGKDLRAALDAVLSSQPVAEDQQPSIGCNIKWKPGNAPKYF